MCSAFSVINLENNMKWQFHAFTTYKYIKKERQTEIKPPATGRICSEHWTENGWWVPLAILTLRNSVAHQNIFSIVIILFLIILNTYLSRICIVHSKVKCILYTLTLLSFFLLLLLAQEEPLNRNEHASEKLTKYHKHT